MRRSSGELYRGLSPCLTSHTSCSKAFQGRTGRAYLFNRVVNYTLGPVEDRELITGLHRVCDMYCKVCEGLIGWKYEHASEESQKYKEGKFILEKAKLAKYMDWSE